MSEENEEFKNKYDELQQVAISRINSIVELLPYKPLNKNWFIRGWMTFQKHAFIYLIFLFLGVCIGIASEKIFNYNRMVTAINLQRFEFQGDMFEVSPSSIRKFYNTSSASSVFFPSTKTTTQNINEEKK